MMSLLHLFIRFDLGKFAKYLRKKPLAKLITSALFLLIFAGVASGIYGFFVIGFKFILSNSETDIRLALTLFLYEVFLIFISLLIILSTAVSGLFHLFRSENNLWILGSPRYSVYPHLVFVRNLFTSSMPMIILFLPAVIALFHVYKVSLLGLLCILLSVVILTVSLTSFTLSFIIGIGYICKLFARKISSQNFSLKNYILTLLGIFIALIFFIYRLVARIDLVHIFKADVATDTIDVQTISTYFHFLPTHPFALEIILFENNDIYQGLFAFLILFFICIISLLLWYFVAPYFYTLWLTLSENISRGTGKEKNKQEKPLHFSGSKTTALFQKEFLILSRNMKGLIWFLFLFCIWLLELASNSILKRNVHKYGSDISSKADILQILHYSIAVYFICAFVLRFVFPAFSTDKKTAWILASSPVNMKKLFYSKYFFYSSFFLLLGIFMSAINVLVLGTAISKALYLIPLFIVTTLFIVTSGLSFGALFPNKESDDPEQISTSMPGLFFTASALLFGALSDAILYLLLKENMIILFISFLFIVIIAIITMLLLVPKKLEQRGFYEQE